MLFRSVLDASGAAGTFATKVVGTSKSVTVTGYSISGADASNYALVQPTGLTANIAALALQVTGVSAANKMRDGNLIATLSGGSISPLAGDLVSLDSSAATGLFLDDMIGLAKPVVVSGYALSGADAGNYSILQPTGITADITDSGVLYPLVTPVPTAQILEPAPALWSPPLVSAVGEVAAGAAPLDIRVSPLSMVSSPPDAVPVGKLFSISASSGQSVSLMRIEFVAGFVPGDTLLQVDPRSALTVSVDNDTGKVTISGEGSPADYARVLKTLVVRSSRGNRMGGMTLKVYVAGSAGESRSTKVEIRREDSSASR